MFLWINRCFVSASWWWRTVTNARTSTCSVTRALSRGRWRQDRTASVVRTVAASRQCTPATRLSTDSLKYVRHVPLHYTTLHYTTLHYTTLHYTTLHYTTLHYTTLHYTTLHHTTPHHTTPHHTTPHHTTPHHTTPHHTHKSSVYKHFQSRISRKTETQKTSLGSISFAFDRCRRQALTILNKYVLMTNIPPITCYWIVLVVHLRQIDPNIQNYIPKLDECDVSWVCVLGPIVFVFPDKITQSSVNEYVGEHS